MSGIGTGAGAGVGAAGAAGSGANPLKRRASAAGLNATTSAGGAAAAGATTVNAPLVMTPMTTATSGGNGGSGGVDKSDMTVVVAPAAKKSKTTSTPSVHNNSNNNNNSTPPSSSSSSSNKNNNNNSTTSTSTSTTGLRMRKLKGKGNAPISEALALAKDSFASFADGQATGANEIVHQVLPRKVLDLTAHLAALPPLQHVIQVPTASAACVPLVKALPVPPWVLSLTPTLLQEVSFMIRQINALSLSIRLRAPSADETSSFGADVQDEALSELSRHEDMANDIQDKLASYNLNRARVCSKVFKYPGVLDYWQSLREMDEYHYSYIRLAYTNLRNSYLLMYDLMVKNQERLKDPTGNKVHITM